MFILSTNPHTRENHTKANVFIEYSIVNYCVSINKLKLKIIIVFAFYCIHQLKYLIILIFYILYVLLILKLYFNLSNKNAEICLVVITYNNFL